MELMGQNDFLLTVLDYCSLWKQKVRAYEKKSGPSLKGDSLASHS